MEPSFDGQESGMEGSTVGFADRLFGLPNQIAIMDHLAEWMRQHLDARFASAQLYDPKLKRLRVVAQREFASGLLDQFGEMSLRRERSAPVRRACNCRFSFLM
ncbi:MAG: hypothetical protein WB752_03465 [Pseudolabrys sp.]